MLADGVLTAPAFVHTGLTNGTLYGYRVAAQTASGSARVSGRKRQPSERAIKAGARDRSLLGSVNAASADLVSG